MEKVVEVPPNGEVRILSGHAGPSPGQGPFLTIRLTLVDHIIRTATYETYPCPGCQACGSAICTMLEGLTIAGARAIKHAMLVEKVGPLPRHRRICYGLALLALSNALHELTGQP